FDIEFDAQPPPVLDFSGNRDASLWQVDLDRFETQAPLPAHRRAQAFTLWLRSCDLDAHRAEIASLISCVLHAKPFTTLQVVFDAGQEKDSLAIRRSLSPRLLDVVTDACQSRPTYLDKFYALQPGRPNGAKRLIVLLPAQVRSQIEAEWLDEFGER